MLDSIKNKSSQPPLLHCFDVFETLVVRAVLRAEDMHLLLGRRLLRRGYISYGGEAFARQRRLAETRAAETLGAHPPLHAIYRELSQSLALPLGQAEALAAEEFALEQELSRKIPIADSLIRRGRGTNNDRVIFVTDINLSAEFIRGLLEGHGLWQTGDQIFTSCDTAVDKARGLMFTHVASTLGVHPRRLLLHGNDPVADVRNGRLSGWRVRHLPDGNPNRYERALGAHASSTEGLSSLFAGASRLARLRATSNSERERTLVDVAAGVMAPTLTAWTIWILQRAVREGCSRLYFLSRDGQGLLEIARRLEPVLQTGLDFRYLYGSRRATQMAAAPHRTLREMLRGEFCRICDFAEALGVPDAELAARLPPQLRGVNCLANLNTYQRQILSDAVLSEGMHDLVVTASECARELLFDYLRQEGWSDGSTFALVDVGWQANMARALSDATKGTDLGRPRHWFFFGLSDNSREVAGPEVSPSLEAWFFDDALHTGYLPPLPNTTSLMEMFCAGDHGPVKGYVRCDGRVEAILRTPSSPMQEWGLPILRETVAEFVDSFSAACLKDPALVDLTIDVRPAIAEVLRLFWMAPTSKEVRHWGSFPVEPTITQDTTLELAEPIVLREILRTALGGHIKLRRQHSWPQGAARRSSWVVKVMLNATWRLRRERPRFHRRRVWIIARLRNIVGKGA